MEGFYDFGPDIIDPLDKAESVIDRVLEISSSVDEPKRSSRRIKRKQFIYTQFVKEGYHCFPEAATDKKYATGDKYDVSHLGVRHMHYFYFKVWIEVKHSNRDIEFIQLRRWLESLYDSGGLELNNQSCEMLSDALYETIIDKYPDVDVIIDVSEENINGSYTQYFQE